jgi:hypothetical protein
MSSHDRTTKIHCLRWVGDMFVGSNDRFVSFMTCYGNLKMLCGRNSSSSIQIKTSYRWKRKRERDRTNLRNGNLCKKMCTINTIAVLVSSFHFNSLFILVSRNFTLPLFSHFHRMYHRCTQYNRIFTLESWETSRLTSMLIDPEQRIDIVEWDRVDICKVNESLHRYNTFVPLIESWKKSSRWVRAVSLVE